MFSAILPSWVSSTPRRTSEIKGLVTLNSFVVNGNIFYSGTPFITKMCHSDAEFLSHSYVDIEGPITEDQTRLKALNTIHASPVDNPYENCKTHGRD